MKLGERLQASQQWPQHSESLPSGDQVDQGVYQEVKSRVHFRLVEQLELATVADLPREALTTSIHDALQDITNAERIPLNQKERKALVVDLMDEILGLGPINPLLKDDRIQDILVNGPQQVYVERDGVLTLTPIQFRDSSHLTQIIDKIVAGVGRRVDESSPMVDARLPDGSRVNVIIPPLSLNGPVLSIRKFGRKPIGRGDLLVSQSLTPEMIEFLRAAVHAKLNILISGGTGAGKTTLLNVLSGYIPDTERVLTIEDSAELRLNQPHVISLEGRPPNVEGRGEVTLTDLVKNSLRMRPDRIIVGEARGGEVMDMLQAMNTGHPGSMSTIHANSQRDALTRLEVMASMGTVAFSERALRGLIASAVNIIVQLVRLPDGKRRVRSVSEITGMEGDTIVTQDIFVFNQEGVDANGRIFGNFNATGIIPIFAEHIKTYGMELRPSLFRFRKEVR
ncbi:MAG: CpaF family protein [Desulfosarcina sp.]|nr:CpaF family protein [Desulfobacterales bacterium]